MDKPIDSYYNTEKKNKTMGNMERDLIIKPGAHYVGTKAYLHIKWEHYEQVPRK